MDSDCAEPAAGVMSVGNECNQVDMDEEKVRVLLHLGANIW